MLNLSPLVSGSPKTPGYSFPQFLVPLKPPSYSFKKLTEGDKGETLLLKEKSHLLESLRVVLYHRAAHYAEQGGHVLLPPYVALDDGLHPLQQQLVDEGDIVHEAGSVVPSPGGQSYGPCSTHHSVEQQHVFIDLLSITQTRKLRIYTCTSACYIALLKLTFQLEERAEGAGQPLRHWEDGKLPAVLQCRGLDYPGLSNGLCGEQSFSPTATPLKPL